MYDASLSILIDRIEASDSGIYSKEKDMCNIQIRIEEINLVE